MDVQRAVTQPEPGLDQLTPRVGADAAIHVEVAFGLERANGGVRPGAEPSAALVGRQFVTEIRQPLLDVDDLGALVSPAIDPHLCSVRPALWTGNELRTGGS